MYLGRLLGGAALALPCLYSVDALPDTAPPNAELFRAGARVLARVDTAAAFAMVSADESWKPLSSPEGTPAHVQSIVPAHGELWAVADNSLWRMRDTNPVSVRLPVGFAFESLRPHEINTECALVNGATSAAVGCFEESHTAAPMLRLVEDVQHCEFLLTTPTTLDFACVAAGPDAALYHHSLNEAPQPVVAGARPVTGVELLARTPTGLVAVVRHKNRVDLATYTSSTGRWARAETPAVHDAVHVEVVSDAHALLVLVDRKSGDRELWTANGRGTLFTKRTALASAESAATAAESAAVKRVGRALYAHDSSSRVIVSKDDGRSWSPDMPTVPDVASVRTSDRINVGLNADGSSLVFSYDGLQWRSEPLRTFDNNNNDNNILLLDYGSVVFVWSRASDTFHYSLTGGRSWTVERLDRPFPQSTSEVAALSDMPLVLLANRDESTPDSLVASILDMTDYIGASCTASEVELVRDSECVMGNRQSRWVRTLGSDLQAESAPKCLMGPSSNFPPPSPEACECSLADYECDDRFVPAGGQLCVPGPTLAAELAKCAAGDRQFVSTGYRRIAGNGCMGGEELSGITHYDCDAREIMAASAPQSVVSAVSEFAGQFKEYLYLPTTKDAESDETVILYTSAGDLLVSQDQGGAWEQRPDIKNVLSVFKSETDANQVYLFTSNSVNHQTIWVSWDRAKTFQEIKLPAPPSVIFGIMPDVVTFHPNHPEWMMYTGTARDCNSVFDCAGVSFVSKDKGRNWKQIQGNSATCQWISGLVDPTHEDLTYCFLMSETAELGFVYSEDYFVSSNKTVPGLERVDGMAVDKPFVVTARMNHETSEIEPFVSVNGKDFSPMRFPKSVKFDKDMGFTLVSTQTQSILIFATANSRMAEEFGVLMKSNSNGSDFVVTLENVNRGQGLFGGFIDFERVKSIEGVALSNVVANADDVMYRGQAKQLRTMITHSDGSLWAPLTAPDGMCNGQKNCNLHLHGYTERLDPRNSPSSPSALGLIVARGNVGESLGEMRSAQTYMSRDGGVTWIKVHDQPMYWEFGDSGSIVVLIDSQDQTKTLLYSLDEGDTWNEYEFNDVPLKVNSIATIPSDSSRKFIIFGRPPVAYGDKTLAVQVDFSGTTNKQCEASDFELWTPVHPQTHSRCLFGHEAQYQRKIRGRACYVGKAFGEDGRIQKPPVNLKTCECQRSDYECDYNYKLNPNAGTCVLEDGLKIPTRDEQCSGGAVSWHKITGYRKIPISTCEGGQMLSSGEEYPCPGMEDEFKRQHGGKSPNSSKGGHSFLGFLFFTFIIISFGVLGYTLVKRKGWLSERLPSLQIPEGVDSGNALSASGHFAMDFLDKALVQVADLWALVSSHLPFIGHRSPRDHLGFYSRMQDDRYAFGSDEYEDDEFEGDESQDEAQAHESDNSE